MLSPVLKSRLHQWIFCLLLRLDRRKSLLIFNHCRNVSHQVSLDLRHACIAGES
jgi:hypothetical protein